MACTLIGGFNKADRPLLASNSDNPYGTRTRIVVDSIDGVKFVGTRIRSHSDSVAWDNMISRAVNESGFAYTWSSVTNDLPPDTNGHDLKATGRRLATCSDISEGVSVLRRGNERVSGCFLFADATTGHIEVVEAAGGKTSTVRLSKDEMTTRANRFQSVELTECESHTDNPYRASAAARTDRVDALAAEELDIERLRGIVTDHDGRGRGDKYGWSICNHGRTHGTVSSELLDPGAAVLYYTFGWPCGEREPECALEEPWDSFLGFPVDLPAGEYTDSNGKLNSSGVRALGADGVEPLHRPIEAKS